MKIAFVNLIKNDKKGFLNNVKYYMGEKLNKIYQKNENFYSYNFNEKTKKKIIKKLKNYSYALTENDTDIGFKTLTGQTFVKYMIYEIYKSLSKRKDEITLLVNTLSEENVEIIKDLASKIKVVNIVTENDAFFNLDRNLERQNVYITVSNNKRKSLKNVEIAVNFDFKSIKRYNFNRNMTIVDLTGTLEIPRAFDGKIIKKLNITTKKKLRIFAEYENFSKSKLMEYQILNLPNYSKIREYIEMNKLKIAD